MIKIPSYSDGLNFGVEPYLLSSNRYVPVTSVRGFTGATVTSLGKKSDLIYFRPKMEISRHINFYGTIKRLFNSTLCYNYGLSVGTLHTRLIPRDKYVFSYGYIYVKETEEILMSLCINKEDFFKITDPENIPEQYFTLLISKKFETEHLDLYRNTKKNYILPMQQRVDVLYTNNISNLCFNSEVISPFISENIITRIQKESELMNNLLIREEGIGIVEDVANIASGLEDVELVDEDEVEELEPEIGDEF